jgi:hypothetical protein
MAYNWNFQSNWTPPRVGTGTPLGGQQNDPWSRINGWLGGLKKPDTSALKTPIITDQYNRMTEGMASLGGEGIKWGPNSTPAGEIAGQAAGEAIGRFAQADIDAQNAWNKTQLDAAALEKDLWGRMGSYSGSGSGSGGDAYPQGPAPGPASSTSDLERQVREKQLRKQLADPTWQEQERANAERVQNLDRLGAERRREREDAFYATPEGRRALEDQKRRGMLADAETKARILKSGREADFDWDRFERNYRDPEADTLARRDYEKRTGLEDWMAAQERERAWREWKRTHPPGYV